MPFYTLSGSFYLASFIIVRLYVNNHVIGGAIFITLILEYGGETEFTSGEKGLMNTIILVI